MAMITMTAEEIMQPLTPEQLKEIDECLKAPIVFDEDCPEQTPEQLAQFRRRSDRLKEMRERDARNEVVIRLSPENMDKARTLGRMRLSKLLEHALNDEELMKRIS